MSELYASMLMIGVTLTLGSVVVAAALGSAGQADRSAYHGASVQRQGERVQLSLAYAAVQSSGSCPAYQGANEGDALSFSVFDYGTTGFTPSELAVNSTTFSGGLQPVSPGAMQTYTVALGSCAHAAGLTIFLADSRGDAFQFAS